MAAEAVDAAHGAEHGSAFPPFDATLFQHQLVWLVISFGALYWLMSRVALPRVAEVLAARKATIQDDLDVAAATSEAAETARREAERSVAEARAGARKIVDDMRAEMAASLSEERAKAEAVLAKRVEAAQARVAESRSQAMAEVDGIADQLARDIVQRLTVRQRELVA